MCLGVYLSHNPHVRLRGQHGGVISFLPLCRFRGLNPSGRTWQRAPLPPWANSLASSFIFHFFGACSTRSLGYWLFIIYSEPSTKKKHIKKHGKSTFRHLWSKSEAGCEETLAWLLRSSDHQGPVEAGSPQLFTEDPGQPMSEPRQRLAVEGLEDVLSLLNPTFVGHPSCIPLPPKIRDNIVRG